MAGAEGDKVAHGTEEGAHLQAEPGVAGGVRRRVIVVVLRDPAADVRVLVAARRGLVERLEFLEAAALPDDQLARVGGADREDLPLVVERPEGALVVLHELARGREIGRRRDSDVGAAEVVPADGGGADGCGSE